MHTTVNPRLWLLARRRADRLAARTEAPALSVPTYVRKRLEPRVQISILRDPAAPIEIQPSIHTPERTSWIDGHDLIGALSLVCLVILFLGV